MSSLHINYSSIYNATYALSFPGANTLKINSNGIAGLDNGSIVGQLGIDPPSSLMISSSSIFTTNSSHIQLYPSLNIAQQPGISLTGNILGILPSEPLSINATGASSSQASVTFSAPSSIGGSPITTYTVYAYLNATGNSVGYQSGVSSPIIMTGLSSASSYAFKVSATNGTGEGPLSVFSNTIITSTVSSAPIIGTAVRGDGSITVNWTAPLNDGGAPIQSYKIYDNNDNLIVNGISPSASSYIITSLSLGTTYSFRVSAVNSVGESAKSDLSNSLLFVTSPSAPYNITGVQGNSVISLSWQSPTSTGGAPISEYTLNTYDNSSLVQNVTTGSLSYNVTNLTYGTYYTFNVSASNGYYASLPSLSTIPIAFATVPSVPTNVTASSADSAATVGWTYPSANGSTITSYTVNTYTGVSYVKSDTATIAPFNVTGLTNGTSYTFGVLATNSIGSSAESTKSSPVTPQLTPDLLFDPGNSASYPAQTSPAPTNATLANCANGTITYAQVTGNPTWNITYGFTFTGSNGALFADPSYLSLNNSTKTFTLWIKPTYGFTSTYNPMMLYKFNGGSSTNGYFLSCTADANPPSGISTHGIGFGFRFGSLVSYSTPNTTFTKGVWKMVSLVANDIGGSGVASLQLFVNGVKYIDTGDGTGMPGGTPIALSTSGYNDATASNNLTIARYNGNYGGSPTAFIGSMSTLSVYNSALTSSQLTTIFNSQKSIYGL